MKGAAVVLAIVAGCAVAHELAVSDSVIRKVNRAQSLWRAEHNEITRLPKEEARKLLGVDMEGLRAYTWRAQEFTAAELAATPAVFDSRQQWPQCDTMRQIRNQKHCGSCWAFAAVEAMSDRECVFNQVNVALSAEDMNSCNKGTVLKCGSCHGGQPGCAWGYWVKHGVVTEECYPYTAGNDTSMDTPKCLSRCTGNTQKVWAQDKHMGKKHYTVTGEENMKTEVATNGPFEVAFTVYEDFMSYASGIYHHVSGSREGGHAVKLVGYGEENGVKFWTLANSWGTGWGEKGFFRIRRGTNECGIESQGWGGIPAPL